MTFHGVARISLGSVFSASATAVWVVTRATGSGMSQIYPLPGRVMKAGRNAARGTGAMRLTPRILASAGKSLWAGRLRRDSEPGTDPRAAHPVKIELNPPPRLADSYP